MVVTRRRLAAVCVALAVLVALPASATRLRIVYTNDLHARLERFASIEEAIAGARASGDPVLLVDAGDAWQDFRVAVYSVWGSRETVDWMNRVGYDAMALGNHDAYVGWPTLRSLARHAAFPVLGANLRPIDGPSWPASARVVRGGLDILVVGLATAEELPLFDLPWLRLRDSVGALRRAIDAAGGSPDLIVCVGHIPLRDAESLARAVPEIDVFVTGHSHGATPVPRVVGQALLVQSGAFGRYVGELTVDVAEGAVRVVDNVLRPIEETAAADVGRGLERLLQIGFGVAALCLLLFL